MKFAARGLALILCLYLAVYSTFAQDNITQDVFFFESGASFLYPQLWELRNNGASVTVSTEGLTVVVFDFAALEALGLTNDLSLADVVEEYVAVFFEGVHTFDASNAEGGRFDDREALRYAFRINDDQDEVLMYVVEFTTGDYGLIVAVSSSGEIQQVEAIEGIAESFQRRVVAEPAAEVTDEAGEVVATTTPVPPTNITCMVTAAEPGTVTMHTGPGASRSVIAFMPAERGINVAGKSFDALGNRWWQLDMDDLGVETAAEQLWVAAADVQAEGACEFIVDAELSPIVPIGGGTPIPPAAFSPGQILRGETNPDVLPEAGAWRVTYGSTQVTCDNGATSGGTALVTTTGYVSLSDNGNTMRFDNRTLNRFQPGVYVARFDQVTSGGVVPAQMTLRVLAPNQLSGQISFTYDLNDTSCTGTTPISLQRGGE